VEMHDNFFLGKEKLDSFIETRIDYGLSQSLQDDDGMINPFIGVYIQMDDSYKITIRKVTTLMMAAADTGGFMSVIFAITIILVKNFQQIIYQSTLIRNFYRITDNSSKIDEAEVESIDSTTSKMLSRLKTRKPL
jgi:phosphate uptake regulator